jgi:AcrR family transcriptional regulator
VYQYFPNKHALFLALHERHIGLAADVMRRRVSQCAESSLERLVESLVDGMVEAHTVDPALSELLLSEVPHRADGTIEFSSGFRKLFVPPLLHIRKGLAGTLISTPELLS